MRADSHSRASEIRPANDIRSGLPQVRNYESTPPTHKTSSPPLHADPRPPAMSRLSRPDFGVFLTLIIGVCVGAGMLLASPFMYVNGARMVLTGLNPSADLDYYRQSLQAYLWERDSALSTVNATPSRWFVESPSSTQLSLCWIGKKESEVVQQLGSTLQAFVKDVNERHSLARAQQSDQENWLNRQSAVLQDQLAKAQGQVEQALADITGDDPLALRQDLMARWTANRDAFTNHRQALHDADKRLDSLMNQHVPTLGVVSQKQRQQAYLANAALQQDLDELRVHLSELKLHLLNIWQQSMPILDELTEAVDNFSQTISEVDSSTDSLPWPALSAMSHQYRTVLLGFSKDWRSDFTTIRNNTIDPTSPMLTRLHETLRSRLSGYLFESGKTLGTTRRQVRAIADSSANDARFHVKYSDLVRSFQQLQSLHHRFEFAAGNIETRRNYRIDISLRASRGLHRRSKQRMKIIDQALDSRALVKAKKQHEENIESAQQAVSATRSRLDDSILDLLALQDRLNINMGISESFLRSSITAAMAGNQASNTKQQLSHTQSQQQIVRQQRLDELPDSTVEYLTCGVIRGPINLHDRLQTALLATILTILAISLSRWRMRHQP